MSDHKATEQMLGYLYQIRYALALLLKNDNPDYQISIEKFDDVAFDKDGHPIQLIQLKHHIKEKGNLTDSSADLWRTIKVWIDCLSQHPELLEMFALNNLEDRKAYTRKSYYESMRDTLVEIHRLNQEENDRGNGCTKE